LRGIKIMKRLIYKKSLSMVLVIAMILSLLPMTSFSAVTEVIGQTNPPSMVSDLNPVIEENSPDLANLVSFA
jgi:hypothetical protein